MATINYNNIYGLPVTAHYHNDGGIRTMYDGKGREQFKAFLDDSIVRKYKNYGEHNGQERVSLAVKQPKNGVEGEFVVLEELACKDSPRGVKNNFLLRGIMNEHGDVVQITKDEKFIEEMVSHGNTYPNSVRRIAKKCLKYFKGRI